MRPVSGWIGWALCLCASCTAVCAQDRAEDDETVLELIRDDDDGLQPGTGGEPAAEFLKCNKVKARWRRSVSQKSVICQ